MNKLLIISLLTAVTTFSAVVSAAHSGENGTALTPGPSGRSAYNQRHGGELRRSLEDLRLAQEQTQYLIRSNLSQIDQERVRYIDARLQSASSLILNSLGNQPSPPPPPPAPPTLGTCVFQSDNSNTFGFWYSSPNIGRADNRMVNNGAVIEILGYESIFYNGEAFKGVRVRVQSNPRVANYKAASAASGEILWAYEIFWARDCK